MEGYIVEFREFKEPTGDTEEDFSKDNKEEEKDYSWRGDDDEDTEEKDYSWMLDDDEWEKDYSHLDVCEDGDIMRYDGFHETREQDENGENQDGNEKPSKTSNDVSNDSYHDEAGKDTGREPSHPDLNEDYFEKIDTKEKAYWLGFIYADGCIDDSNKSANFKRLYLGIDKKDESILDNFINAINANKEKKEYVGNEVRIRVLSWNMCENLARYGCVPRKSNIIEFPNLGDKKYDLAFLLGYYDGDGKQGTTLITTGSKKFLEGIKQEFELNSKIWKEENISFIEGRKIQGVVFRMCLGADLFNKMMENYTASLPRKRCHFTTQEERAELAAEASRSNTGKPKFNMTREELEKEVWKKPSIQIAKEHGVSDRLITKKCRQYGIDKPPRGYWAKKYSEDKKKTAGAEDEYDPLVET
ncbi:MAG: hypothetical protein ACFFCS_18810 [Candidatus Hodarchaeota archaeon]